jgi:hypothetical protein
VCLKKAVFVFDAEQALIISKIDPPNVYDIVFVHPTIIAISDTRARDEVLPRNGIHALTISRDSSISRTVGSNISRVVGRTAATTEPISPQEIVSNSSALSLLPLGGSPARTASILWIDERGAEQPRGSTALTSEECASPVPVL